MTSRITKILLGGLIVVALVPISLSLLVVSNKIVDAFSDSDNQGFATPFTVELDSKYARHTLKAPFGTFFISANADVDEDNNYVKLFAVEMKWHYQNETPWYLWQQQLAPGITRGSKEFNALVPDDVFLSVTLDTSDPGTDLAENAKYVYLDSFLKSSRGELRPIDEGDVWQGEARQYAVRFKNGITKLTYLINKRDDNDGRVIQCTHAAVYCTLRGARYDDYLRFDAISVPVNDVQNWRDYQQKARRLIKQAITNIQYK